MLNRDLGEICLRLPSGAGVMSVMRRCGLGTGAGHTYFPKAGTSGRVKTIS